MKSIRLHMTRIILCLIGMAAITGTMIMGCDRGDAEDHYSTGRIVRIYYSVSQDDTTYRVDFVPDDFPADTATLEVDKATFDVTQKGNVVDYQKLRNQ